TRCRRDKGRYHKRRRLSTVSFRASGADVDVLRRHILAKASLISLHWRAIASGCIIFNKFHLFLFPHRIQRLARVVTCFIGYLPCDTVTIEWATRQREKGVKELIVITFALL